MPKVKIIEKIKLYLFINFIYLIFNKINKIMNKSNLLYVLISSFLLFSCSNDEGNYYSGNKQVNDFVWKGLNSWYYWKNDVPNLADNKASSNDYNALIGNKTPDQLFYSLLNNYGTVDRFSWIVSDVDELLKSFSGKKVSSGMDLSLTLLDPIDKNVLALVNYVVPNSPADLQGVKRGDVILRINGRVLNTDNYRLLFSESFNVQVGKKPYIEDGALKVESTSDVSIRGVELDENPVYFSKIIQEGNKKIGYLVYNGFQSIYNDELNEVFGEFKSQGVTDLILDLRYNGGGSLSTAVGLGQMITGQFTNSPFVSLEFNQKHTNENSVENLSTDLPLYDFINGQSKFIGTEKINSLNLDKVYVLTGRGTASASELTITGLQPYINVVKIGEKTYGKFVGSITLFDSPNSDFTNYNNKSINHKYAMQPIVFAYFNANHQIFNEGVSPNYELSFDDYIGMGDFGEKTDAAYAKAMQLITGDMSRYRAIPKAKMKKTSIFLGTTKTMQQFGTELYIESFVQ